MNEFYDNLVKLHELWYKINGLQIKLSAHAEKLKSNYTADFHSLNSKVLPIIKERFITWVEKIGYDKWPPERSWLKFSTCPWVCMEHRPIWWDNIKQIIGQRGYSALAICCGKEEPKDNNFCFKHERNWYKFNISKDVMEDIVKNSYKTNAWEENIEIKSRDRAWVAMRQNVEDVNKKLESVDESNINKVMEIITLCLNTAHYHGKMLAECYDFQLGLTIEELKQLSNLDTTKWDKDLDRIK